MLLTKGDRNGLHELDNLKRHENTEDYRDQIIQYGYIAIAKHRSNELEQNNG